MGDLLAGSGHPADQATLGICTGFTFVAGKISILFQTVGWVALIAYLAVAGITILAGGVEYGIRQYQDYFGFLARLTRDFPWWGPDKPFLGYNHSVMQIVLYYLGVSTVKYAACNDHETDFACFRWDGSV